MQLVGLLTVLTIAASMSLQNAAPPVGIEHKANWCQVADLNPCGDAAWTIIDTKKGTTLFNGKAECTKVEDNGQLTSIMKGFTLNITYQEAGTTRCSNGGRVTVDLGGHYMAGHGSPAPPPGSSCSFDINPLPHHPALVSGGLTAVLGGCLVAGGCAQASDWDLISVKGSFHAYYRGP
jgi:hypothetical protein